MLLKASVTAASPDSISVWVRVNKHLETTLSLGRNTPGFRNVCKNQTVLKGDQLNIAVRFYATKPPGEQLKIIRISKLVPQTALVG